MSEQYIMKLEIEGKVCIGECLIACTLPVILTIMTMTINLLYCMICLADRDS